MTRRPALHVRAPRVVTAVALVLHGGRAHSLAPTRPHHLAVLRMLPFATALRRAGRAEGLAVARLRYARRGWNGDEQSPVTDTLWALDDLARRFPGVPVALVGHSMGGRTALHVAGHPSVRAVVALAPWIEDGDPVAQLAGRRVLIAHGTEDPTTSPDASAAYARRAGDAPDRGDGTVVSYVEVGDERHALLRRARLWHSLSTGYVLGVLYGRAPDPSLPRDTSTVIVQALAGQARLVV